MDDHPTLLQAAGFTPIRVRGVVVGRILTRVQSISGRPGRGVLVAWAYVSRSGSVIGCEFRRDAIAGARKERL